MLKFAHNPFFLKPSFSNADPSRLGPAKHSIVFNIRHWLLLALTVVSPASFAVIGTQLGTDHIAPQSCAVIGAYGICSATQIGDSTLLSAAHCFNARSPQPPLVKCDDSEVWQPTERVTLHPSFDPRPVPGEPFPNDVALIHLKQPMASVPAIPVFDRGLFDIILADTNASCQLSGFGGSDTANIRESAISLNAKYHQIDELRGGLLRQEGERIQGGDSGGGLLCNWYGHWYAMAVHETVNRVELTYTNDASEVVFTDHHIYGMSRPLYHYQSWYDAPNLIR